MDTIISQYPLLTAALLTLAAAALLTLLIQSLRRRNSAFTTPFVSTRTLVLPTAYLLYLCSAEFGLSTESRTVKLVETLLGIEAIWVVLSAFKAVVVTRATDQRGQLKISGLFLDIVRFAFIVIGSGIVIALVWHHDLGNWIATLGVGSLVLGLALQETLGNLFAGISIAFERPFSLGDWIKIGEIEGEVIETNWRAVRLRPRALDSVVVPNSVLGRERITNFSRPNRLHGCNAYVGFSYSDPPNKVKQVLMELMLSTDGILSLPPPVVRTKRYEDSQITYEVRYFIDEYSKMPDIEEAFMTKVWYAARRYGLTIPFPIRTVYKTEVPPAPAIDPLEEAAMTLRAIPLFAPLTENEIANLAGRVVRKEFARGESIVRQGEAGDSLYIVQHGSAVVTNRDNAGIEHILYEMTQGEFFGEMALLTGEPRSATVTARGDLSVLRIDKQQIGELFAKRPEIAAQMAEVAAKRRGEIIDRHATTASAVLPQKETADPGLLRRIKEFFALS